MAVIRTHFGDPCIHCGVAHDAILAGPCTGGGKPIPIGYASMGVRYDGIERFRVLFSNNHIEERYAHVSEHAPYYHFGHSDHLRQPPHQIRRLKLDPRP